MNIPFRKNELLTKKNMRKQICINFKKTKEQFLKKTGTQIGGHSLIWLVKQLQYFDTIKPKIVFYCPAL